MAKNPFRRGSGEIDSSGEKRVILPAHDPTHGRPCCKDWCEEAKSFVCGCPACLHERSETLVYSAEDMDETPVRRFWRQRVVSEKVGLLAPEHIVPGYPGGIETGPTE